MRREILLNSRWEQEIFFPSKATKHELETTRLPDLCLPSSSEVKNMWICTLYPIRLHDCDRKNRIL